MCTMWKLENFSTTYLHFYVKSNLPKSISKQLKLSKMALKYVSGKRILKFTHWDEVFTRVFWQKPSDLPNVAKKKWNWLTSIKENLAASRYLIKIVSFVRASATSFCFGHHTGIFFYFQDLRESCRSYGRCLRWSNVVLQKKEKINF